MSFYFGIRLSKGAAWIGYHYQSHRLCINIIPFVTLFFVFTGGNIPNKYKWMIWLDLEKLWNATAICFSWKVFKK